MSHPLPAVDIVLLCAWELPPSLLDSTTPSLCCPHRHSNPHQPRQFPCQLHPLNIHLKSLKWMASGSRCMSQTPLYLVPQPDNKNPHRSSKSRQRSRLVSRLTLHPPLLLTFILLISTLRSFSSTLDLSTFYPHSFTLISDVQIPLPLVSLFRKSLPFFITRLHTPLLDSRPPSSTTVQSQIGTPKTPTRDPLCVGSG